MTFYDEILDVVDDEEQAGQLAMRLESRLPDSIFEGGGGGTETLDYDLLSGLLEGSEQSDVNASALQTLRRDIDRLKSLTDLDDLAEQGMIVGDVGVDLSSTTYNGGDAERTTLASPGRIGEFVGAEIHKFRVVDLSGSLIDEQYDWQLYLDHDSDEHPEPPAYLGEAVTPPGQTGDEWIELEDPIVLSTTPTVDLVVQYDERNGIRNPAGSDSTVTVALEATR